MRINWAKYALSKVPHYKTNATSSRASSSLPSRMMVSSRGAVKMLARSASNASMSGTSCTCDAWKQDHGIRETSCVHTRKGKRFTDSILCIVIATYDKNHRQVQTQLKKKLNNRNDDTACARFNYTNLHVGVRRIGIWVCFLKIEHKSYVWPPVVDPHTSVPQSPPWRISVQNKIWH